MSARTTCEHGVEWDDDCAACNAELHEARLAMASTPHEIGVYFRGKAAGLARAERAERLLSRVRVLAEGPMSNVYRPYAMSLCGDVVLVVPLDDLRAALEDEQPPDSVIPTT